jgi:hypothetical protein
MSFFLKRDADDYQYGLVKYTILCTVKNINMWKIEKWELKRNLKNTLEIGTGVIR